MQGKRDGKLLRSEQWRAYDMSDCDADFYIAPDGNDAWSGKLPSPNSTKTDGPFASLHRAQSAVQELKKEVYIAKTMVSDLRYVGSPHEYGQGRDITVLLRGGQYFLNKALQLKSADGGERIETEMPTGAFEFHHLKDHYVTYASYPNERVQLIAGTKVTQWKKEGKYWVAPCDMPVVPALIVNGKEQVLARIPTQGYFHASKMGTDTKELYFKPADLAGTRSFCEKDDNRIIMLLRWHTGRNSIERIDMEKGIAYLKEPQPGIVVVPPRFYLENSLEFLKAIGQWYFDKQQKKIYYLASQDVADMNNSLCYIPQLSNILEVTGEEKKVVRNLRFYGLHLEGGINSASADSQEKAEGAAQGLQGEGPKSSALTFHYAHACEFAHGSISHCGGAGIQVLSGCYQIKIFRNTFANIKGEAVFIHGPKPAMNTPALHNIQKLEAGTLSAEIASDATAIEHLIAIKRVVHGQSNIRLEQLIRETELSYNYFTDCGGAATIFAAFSLHTKISRNYLTRNHGRYTIGCGGWSNIEEAVDGDYLIEYNHIEDVQAESDDSGAIVTAGMTFNSYIVGNLIHYVHRGFFNDNVAIWFDNMSSNWVARNNIFYKLEQAAWKLCAAYASDIVYEDNFQIEEPQVKPKMFLEQEPNFYCSNIQFADSKLTSGSTIPAGTMLTISADVFNAGGTGCAPIVLLLNHRIIQQQNFACIAQNKRKISFNLHLTEIGNHSIGIGDSQFLQIKVTGQKPKLLVEDITLTQTRIFAGQSLIAKARIRNLETSTVNENICLKLDDEVIQQKACSLNAKEQQEISFEFNAPLGEHTVSINMSPQIKLTVIQGKDIDIARTQLIQYISSKGQPGKFEIDAEQRNFKLSAAGYDFYHAEDGYAALYIKDVVGDFIATIKVVAFTQAVQDWFRAGIFARNDISKSFDADRGSAGAVLMYTTHACAGICYDEFADGCMHYQAMGNYPPHSQAPYWLKLERHGDRFTGYASLDGTTWLQEYQTGIVAQLNSKLDVGIAVGANDGKVYTAEITDWKLHVAK